jgi:hypothetical protein
LFLKFEIGGNVKTEFKGLPLFATYLGYGGVLPFLGLAIGSYMGFDLEVLLGLSVEAWMAVYAAIILSFLGAIYWGVVIALNEKLNANEINVLLIYSITPALLAWISFLFSLKITLLILSLLVLFSYFLDCLILFKRIEKHISLKLSKEFARLRLHLSIAVSFLLFITAINVI